MNRTTILHFTAWAVFTVTAAIGCGDTDEVDPSSGGLCQADGDCPAGFACNLPGSAFFAAGEPESTCLNITCSDDNDCENGQVCEAGVCSAVGCQVDPDCSGGFVCSAGACEPAPSASDVARCSVVAIQRTVRTGNEVELSALAEDASGASLRGVKYVWSSDNEGAVRVEARTENDQPVAYAIGGQLPGRAILTAAVENSTVQCSGNAIVENLVETPPDDARVTLVAETGGAPISDATVRLVTVDGPFEQSTDGQGSTVFEAAGEVTRVTVFKPGYATVTVVQPGTQDIFIPIPQTDASSATGGFRGTMDVSTSREDSFKIGFAGPALPLNPLDLSIDGLAGDIISTDLDLSDFNLGIISDILLPGGLVGAIGFANQPMVNDDRCVEPDGRPGTEEVGCFVAQAPEGQTAGWGLAGQLGIEDVTPLIDLIDEISSGDDVQYGDALVSALPLVARLRHAIIPALEISAVPRLPNGDSDIRRYARHDLFAGQPLDRASVLTVPNMPGEPGNCADASVVVAGTILEGRGLVPLGLGGALDETGPGGAPDCRVDGIQDALGLDTISTEDGQMALTTAVPHSGAEAGEPFMIVAAGDIDTLLSGAELGLQLTALVQRAPSGIGTEVSVSGGYLDIPQGSIRRATRQVELAESVNGATMHRFTMYSGAETWVMYVPATETVADLNEPSLETFVANIDSGFLLSMEMDGTYAENFELGSGKTLDRLIYTTERFSIQQCTDAAEGLCRLE